MKKKLASKSAFSNPRVLISFAFFSVSILLALLAFAFYPGGNALAKGPQQNQLSVPGLTQENVTVLQGQFTQEQWLPSAPVVALTAVAEHVIDLAALGIRPLAAPLAPGTALGTISPGPLSAEVGDDAVLSVSPEIGMASTTRAFSTVGGNFIPGENVQVFLSGTLVGTFAADATGRLSLSINTGAGSGFITIDEIGVTSGREAGAVVQQSATGPFLPGFAAAPHAINATGATTITVNVRGFLPAGTPLNFKRNGVVIATATSGATGGGTFVLTPAAAANSSAVYSVDSGTAGSLAGQTLEERSDAGTPPVGDQNISRAFFDRAVLDSAVGGAVTLVGEGFQTGETVTLSGCAAGAGTAGSNRSIAFVITFGAGAGNTQCVLTGGLTGRVARASLQADPLVTNIRGLIAAPASVSPGGTGLVVADRMLPNDTGNIYLDGVLQGTATTNASGFGLFILTKPTTGFVHAVSWIATTGAGPDQATVLLLGASSADCLFINGGFETNVSPSPTPGPSGTFVPWVIPPAQSVPTPVISTLQAHGGTQSVFLGTLSGTEPTGDSSIYQTITVPASGGMLSFWYYPNTVDTIAFDWQDAYVADATGTTILATIMHVQQCTSLDTGYL